MLRLEPDTLQELCDILTPLMREEKDRLALLTLALGANCPVLDRIDYKGKVSTFIPEIIRRLNEYGEYKDKKNAVLVLLEYVCSQVGLDIQQKINLLQSKIHEKLAVEVTSSTLLISDTTSPEVKLYVEGIKSFIHQDFPGQWKVINRQDISYGEIPSIQQCGEVVANCGAIISVIGTFYGSFSEEEAIGYAEHELRLAKKKNKSIFCLIIKDDLPGGIAYDYVSSQMQFSDRQKAFLESIESKELEVNFKSVLNLEEALEAIKSYLLNLENFKPGKIEIQQIYTEVPFAGNDHNLDYDQLPVLRYSLGDLDNKLVDSYLEQSLAVRDLRKFNKLNVSRKEQLRALGLLTESGQPTIGAFLCFAPRNLIINSFPAIGLHMVVFSGEKRSSSNASPDYLQDNLLSLFDAGMNFLNLNSGLQRIGLIGTDKRDDLEIPVKSLREALANSLIHRDYKDSLSRKQPTRIEVYSNRIEFTSFGGIVDGISIQKLNTDPESITPLRRNTKIANIFRIMKHAELNASGVSRMHDLAKEASLPPPNIVQIDDIPAVKVIFIRNTSRLSLDSLQIVTEDYCGQIRRVFNDVKFSGIAVEGNDMERAERLADIFVIPDVQEEDGAGVWSVPEDMPPAGMDDPQQRLIWEQRQQIVLYRQRISGHQFSATSLLTEGRTNRAVLLGGPGSGKTTLMNYFAVAATSQTAKMLDQINAAKDKSKKDLNLLPFTCLPIIIRIRDLARHPDLPILEFVREFTEKDLVVTHNLTGFFEYYLENGNALILLDGLDEVADLAQRYKVVEKIEFFLNQFEDCPAIITSRPAGYKRDFFRTDEYPHYELQLFDDEKIDIFIDHWYDSRFELESEQERRKISLRRAIKDQSRIKQLARNPLLLTIIALIHRYQAILPKDDYKLYDKAVETLLTTWDSQKELSNHEVLKYLELDDLRRLMERLAYWIHCQGGVGDTEGGTLIGRDELIFQLTQYIQEMKRVERHQAKAEAKRFLEQIVRDRAGLLSLQGQDCYAFVHKTFQEYLTAMEIRDQQEEGFEVVLEHIDQYLHKPHWEEVLLLVIAQQKRKSPVKIIQLILNHDTLYEEWLHRNLLFAGKVLTKNVPVADINLTSSILGSLMDLEVTQSPLVTHNLRSQIFRIISSMQETAFESLALEQLEVRRSEFEHWQFLAYQSVLAPSEATVTLLSLLQDSDSDIRYRAAKTLENLGKSSDHVISALLTLLEDSDTDVRYRAAKTLENLGKSTATSSSVLLNHMQDSLADETLISSAQSTNESIAVLLAQLQENSPEILSRVTRTLVDLGRQSDAIERALVKWIEQHQDKNFVGNGIDVLWELVS